MGRLLCQGRRLRRPAHSRCGSAAGSFGGHQGRQVRSGALPIYWLARTPGLWGVATAAAVITAIGIWTSSRVAKLSGLKDPQFVCVDEVAGVLITWLGAPSGWRGTIVGLVLFRILDWWKPYPARACERLPGGFGIVLDDVAAGV